MFILYRKLLLDVSHVTVEDLKRVGKLYFKKLFEPSETTTAISCNSTKIQEVKIGLEKLVSDVYQCSLILL